MSCGALLTGWERDRSNSVTRRAGTIGAMVKVVRATQLELDTAVQALRDGELVAFPTETVYGLGAHAAIPAALRRVFELKGRPTDPSADRASGQPALSDALGARDAEPRPSGWPSASGPGR